jgi:hypothetical protein
MNPKDIYSRNIDYVAERCNFRLSKFINVPTREFNGVCFLAFEGSITKDLWNPERDWNQLMMIIDEIEKIEGVKVNIIGQSCEILKSNKDETISVCKHVGGSRLDSVYRCCADFVNNVAFR